LAVIVVVCSGITRWTSTRAEYLDKGWCSAPALETRWITRPVVLPGVGVLN
jgi:hypothetical protein